MCCLSITRHGWRLGQESEHESEKGFSSNNHSPSAGGGQSNLKLGTACNPLGGAKNERCQLDPLPAKKKNKDKKQNSSKSKATTVQFYTYPKAPASGRMMQLRRRFIVLRNLSLIEPGRQCDPSRNKSQRGRREARTRSAKKPLCLASAPQEAKRAEMKGSCWLAGGMKHPDPEGVGLARHQTAFLLSARRECQWSASGTSGSRVALFVAPALFQSQGCLPFVVLLTSSRSCPWNS